jgi:hypothetical protein
MHGVALDVKVAPIYVHSAGDMVRASAGGLIMMKVAMHLARNHCQTVIES